MKYAIVLISGYGEIYPLAPDIDLKVKSPTELSLTWEHGVHGRIETILPLLVPAEQNLFGGDPKIKPSSSLRCQNRGSAVAIPLEDLCDRFSKLMQEGIFVDLDESIAELGDAIGVRKKTKTGWARYLLASRLRDFFPKSSERNRLVGRLRKKGVFRRGRRADTSTRELVINSTKHAVYRVSMPALRRL